MVTIRAAEKQDIQRIIELLDELVITTSPSEVTRNVDISDYTSAFERIRSTEGHDLLVAEDNDKIIGTMALIIVPNLSHGGMPWAGVENVMVDIAYRRRGVGKLLMEYALNQAKEAGCYKIQLISAKTRTEAHKFYDSLGFQASGHGFRLYL